MSESEGSLSETKKRRTEEELYKVFRKSKKVGRSPEKADERREEKSRVEKSTGRTEDDEEIRNIWKEMLKEIKEIKLNQVKTNEEIKEMKEEMKKISERLEQKCKTLEEKCESLERRVEFLEKEDKKKNLVIKGVDIKGGRKEIRKEIEGMIKETLGIEKKIEEATEIRKGIVIIKMENIEDRNKGKMKGTKIYIDEDLTKKEREIQTIIRMEAKKLEKEGNIVKIRYKKIPESNTSPFSRIPTDQIIEETVNMDIHTARGTRNYNLKSRAISRSYLRAEFGAMTERATECHMCQQS
ncbi:hypothetical protein FQR65_LT00831 [Abscondita terminalis]|nr:hypothetical protein FQR65_LT00831 [Abscondita terminalis]